MSAIVRDRALRAPIRRHAMPVTVALGRALADAIMDNQLVDVAAQLSYWTVLAMFPLAVAALAVVGRVPVQGLDLALPNLLAVLMPADVAALCASVVRQAAAAEPGLLPLLALGVGLWLASSAVSALMLALDGAWRVSESRGYVRRKLLALGLAGAALLGLCVVLTALVLASALGDRLLAQVGAALAPLTRLFVRWGVTYTAMLVVACLVYRLLPNLRGGPHHVLPGALLASGAWVLVSLAFGAYVSGLHSYTRVYGALGTAIVLFTWLYLGALVLLIGGALNAVLDTCGGEMPR